MCPCERRLCLACTTTVAQPQTERTDERAAAHKVVRRIAGKVRNQPLIKSCRFVSPIYIYTHSQYGKPRMSRLALDGGKRP